MSELKPCPICRSRVTSNLSYGATTINCTSENCIMIGCLLDHEPYVNEIEQRWNKSYFAKLEEENKELQQRLKEAESVLKMYASRNNWNSSTNPIMLCEYIGGETAREYFKKWEREE